LVPTRDQVWTLLCQYTESDQLRKHHLAVEAAMKYYARKFGEDENVWGNIGLIHDFEYEKFPDDHLGLPRTHLVDKTLYAVDELTGLVIAVALVRPSKKLADVDVAAVKKKWKDKAFARGVNRQQIERGATELGVPLDEHIRNVIDALQGAHEELGL
jgi:predicted hydrolase (HD superfamily)